jgi:hypothetical protein
MAQINEMPIELSLKETRAIVLALMKIISSVGFKKCDTVIMLSTTATNELYTALWFLAFCIIL